jgi:hypothetical protein
LSLDEVAGLTDEQLLEVYFRPRTKYGKLKRQDEIETKVVNLSSFKAIFFHAKKSQSKYLLKMKAIINGNPFQGYKKDDIEKMWKKYIKENPGLLS